MLKRTRQNTKASDVTIEICGSAGDGSIAAGQILNLAMTLVGYHVINFDSYPAEIRGFGKSVAHTRISEARRYTTSSRVDCLVSLNDPHAITSLDTLKENGIVIYDRKPLDFVEEDQAIAGCIEPGMVGYGVPLHRLSVTATKSARSRNIVALGAIAGIFRIQPEAFHQAIKKRFSGKRPEMVESNIRAFDGGYSFASEELVKADHIDFAHHSPGAAEGVKIVSGNEAVARACLDAGIALYAGYPITPATKILEILAKELPKNGGIAIQTEDEISAIGHVIGAGFTGQRAVTATSGPGFCLMAEFINLAVMAEVPIVVIDSQRAGPSTGMPTKTEQGDLNFAIFGGTGDSPRPVLAPATVEECYEIVRKAFELAEAFQTPVIVLLDFFLSNRMEDVYWEKVSPDRFGSYTPVSAVAGQEPYLRYKITDTGLSPRAVPGMEGLYHTCTGLEHDEMGLPDYIPENHVVMTSKRHKKLETLIQQWPAPKPVGDKGTLDVGIISWGSTIGAVMEAMDGLRGKGLKVGGLFPRLMWPVHADAIRKFSDRAQNLLVVEMNASAQFGNIVQSVAGRDLEKFCKVQGTPLPVSEIGEAIVRAAERGSKK